MKKLWLKFAAWADAQRQKAIDEHLGRYQVELWIDNHNYVSVPLTSIIGYGRRGCHDKFIRRDPGDDGEFKLTVLKK